MSTNTVQAVFKKENDFPIVYGLYQWDSGQKLQIFGLKLPEIVEVHFSVLRYCNDAVRMIGSTIDEITTVDIPDKLLQQPNDLVAYIYVTDPESCKTTHKIMIHVNPRQKPADYQEGEYTDDKIAEMLEAVKQIMNSKPDAREIEFQKGKNAIQWRYIGEPEWRDLISLDEISGDVEDKEELQGAVNKYFETNGIEEKDPTVAQWAKEKKKPEYVYDEILEAPIELSNMEIEKMINSIGGLS